MEQSEGKRECELKYKVQDTVEKIRLIEKLKSLGFKFNSNNLESDYTPDVEGFLCRENGMMLRFRVIEGTQNDVLITLKIKGKGKEFQDNYEIETLLSDFDINKFNAINNKLSEKAHQTIPFGITSLKTIKDIREYLAQNVFSQHRMFSQKRRMEYMKEEGPKITIDEFPRGIGTFLEIETETPEELFETVQILGLNQKNFEKRNYGEIIKEKQKGLPEEERRTCIFDEQNECEHEI